MDNLKNDIYYVRKIIDDMQLLVDHTANIKAEEFEINSIICDSVLFRIIQISESASKLSETFKNEHDNVPWKSIKGMRNKIVHEYGTVNSEIIFDTVTTDIPIALKLLTDILEKISG